MGKKRILVVDDDPNILDAIQFMLEDAGYEAAITEKGEYAERLHDKKSQPDLILLDVLLSGRDGRVICKKLKNQTKTKHIPIIMISAHPNAEKLSLESGADGFLEKPFKIKDLLAMIEKHIAA